MLDMYDSSIEDVLDFSAYPQRHPFDVCVTVDVPATDSRAFHDMVAAEIGLCEEDAKDYEEDLAEPGAADLYDVDSYQPIPWPRCELAEANEGGRPATRSDGDGDAVMAAVKLSWDGMSTPTLHLAGVQALSLTGVLCRHRFPGSITLTIEDPNFNEATALEHDHRRHQRTRGAGAGRGVARRARTEKFRAPSSGEDLSSPANASFRRWEYGVWPRP